MAKNKAAVIALLLLLAAAVSGCTKTSGTADTDTAGAAQTNQEPGSSGFSSGGGETDSSAESSQTEASEEKTAPSQAEDMKPAGPLTDAELAEIQKLFDQTSERVCLTSYYERPEDISIDAVFYSFLSMGQEVSEEELNLLQLGEVFDTAKYPVKDMNEFLLSHFGITLDQVKGKEIEMPYLPQYDAYYVNVSDTNIVVPTCISGERKADQTLEVLYTTMEEDGQWMAVLKPENGSYRYLSNVNLSAQHNRDYLLALEQRKGSLESLETSSMAYYYDKSSGQLVYAVDKPADSDAYGVREIYFENGSCILIQFRELDEDNVWIDPKAAYCEELDVYVGGTREYYQGIGEEIKAEFAAIRQ